MLCPVCGRKLEVKTTAYNAFDKILLISILCECGFKHTDSIVAEIKEPMRFTVKVKKDNLFTKVIRSTSGTIRIPEIGVSIEPGPASQAFITNLEGVLARVEDIVRVAKLWSDDFEKVKRCNWILKRIRNTIEGEEELTLILEDPFGNSIILGNAVQEPIDEKEALSLKTGLHNGLR